jgi:hypothetical protein
MAEKRELSHQFPDEPNLRERIGSTGLRFNAGAENVAYAPTIEELHAGLMKSPPHRANILDPKFNAVGIGIAPSGGDLYVAQNFARTVPSYTEDQFRDAVVGAFQKARLQSGAQKIAVESDVHLHDVACSQKPDPNAILASLPGATDLVVFTSSSPEKFPQQMSAAASDKTLNRMKIGACFQPGPEHGYASFQVVTAFYPK